jgi:uncharacterized RDD family membrane protein YckC
MSDDLIRVPTGLTTDGLLGRRYLARIIDTVILALLAGTVTLLLAVVMQPIGRRLGLLISLSLLLVIWIAYGALLESSSWQATIGKRITGLRVYNSAGGRLSLGQAASRCLVKDGPFFLFSPPPFGNVLGWSGSAAIWSFCTGVRSIKRSTIRPRRPGLRPSKAPHSSI